MTYHVMLFGGHHATPNPVVTVPYLAPVIERAVEFRRAGIWIESYAVDATTLWPLANGCANAVYQGLRRSDELARHFDPARLPH